MKLKIGEYIVKAGEGVCKVKEKILMRLIPGEPEMNYYMLCPVQDERDRVYIPEQKDYEDIRPVMSQKEANLLLDSLNDLKHIKIADDKEREEIYKNYVRSGDPRKMVILIKTLYNHCKQREKHGKKTTTIDDRYLRLCEKALYSEIAFVLNKQMDEVHEIMMQSIEKKRTRRSAAEMPVKEVKAKEAAKDGKTVKPVRDDKVVKIAAKETAKAAKTKETTKAAKAKETAKTAKTKETAKTAKAKETAKTAKTKETTKAAKAKETAKTAKTKGTVKTAKTGKKTAGK